jgi:iron complex outermembrane receptor protein
VVLGLLLVAGLAFQVSAQPAETRGAAEELTQVNVENRIGDGTAEVGYKVEETHNLGPWGDRKLQDTPYTMIILSEELLQNTMIKDTTSLNRMMPHSRIESGFNTNNTMIATRGNANSNPLINGIRGASGQGIFLENIADVEILSGFSGFMYGVGTSGGLLNFNLKRPTKELKFKTTIGDYGGGEYHADIDVGGPLKDGLFGYRLNLMAEDGSTAVKNQDIRKGLASLALDFQPSDRLIVRSNFYYGKYHVDGLQHGFSSYFAPKLVPIVDNRKLWSPKATFMDVKVFDGGLGIESNLNDTFTIRAAWNHKENEVKTLNSGNTVRRDANTNIIGFTTQASASVAKEIADGGYAYIDSKFTTFGAKHQVTAGFNGYIRTDKHGIFRNPDGSLRVAMVGDTSPMYRWGDSHSVENFYVPDLFRSFVNLRKAAETVNYNFMLGDVIDFNEKWTLMGGINYSRISTKGFNAATGVQTAEYNSHSWSPSVSLLFKPIPQVTTYFTYIDSLEPSVVVGPTYKNAGEVLPPYQSKEYEFGIKTELPGGALLSLALYRLEIPSQMSDDGTNTGRLTQDGRQINKGLDANITGKIGQRLTLVGGYSYVDAKIKKSADPSVIGNWGIGVPRDTFKMYAEYDLPFVDGLTLTGGAYYNGKTNTSNPNNGITYPGYTLFDLGARFKTVIKGVETIFRFNITNLTNKNAWVNPNLNNPRMFSLTASFGF